MSNPCISSSKVAGTAVYNASGDKLGSSMPEYTDDYGRKVYDYYGVPWH
jgi:hypothetical protein